MHIPAMQGRQMAAEVPRSDVKADTAGKSSAERVVGVRDSSEGV